MNAVIVGNGRTGSTLARSLIASGHSVTLIDLDPGIDGSLGADATTPGSIRTIEGDGTRNATLERARIRDADIFASLTGDDCTNGLAALKARTTYRVPTVLASIWSGDLTSVFESLGVACVNPARLSVDTIMSNLPQALADKPNQGGGA